MFLGRKNQQCEYGYSAKCNVQKSLAFLYTKNGKSEREIKESNPLTIATKKIKYLGINLPKETKNCTQKIMTLTKEIKDNMHRQRDNPCSWVLGRKNKYCENDYTTKGNLQIQCDLYEITSYIFHRTRTKNSQFIWKHKRP